MVPSEFLLYISEYVTVIQLHNTMEEFHEDTWFRWGYKNVFAIEWSPTDWLYKYALACQKSDCTEEHRDSK